MSTPSLAGKALRAAAGLGLIAGAVGIAWWLNSGDPDAAFGGGGFDRGGAVTVITEPVQMMPFGQEIEALGTARANESVDITSRVAGIVRRIHFTEGEQVAEGEVLVELDDSEQRAALAEAQAALVESASQAQRAERLHDRRAVSESELSELRSIRDANQARVDAAQARLEDFLVRAPFDGRTGLRRVSRGALVSPGDSITTLDDISTIKVEFSVPEPALAAVERGMRIEARTSAFRTEDFVGEVESIDSRLDPVSRSLAVVARIPNPEARLRPGMFFNVRLSRPEELVPVIAEGAVVPQQNRQFVYVVSEGRAERREILTGRRRVGIVEVVQGLEAGDEIVVEGTQKVRQGAQVRALAGGSLPEDDAQ